MFSGGVGGGNGEINEITDIGFSGGENLEGGKSLIIYILSLISFFWVYACVRARPRE